MKAFIREDRWNEFKEICSKYKFGVCYAKPKTYFQKEVDVDLLLLVSKRTREMKLVTPMGESPFMEVHINTYQDLYDDGFVEFVEGRFD